MIAPVLWSGLLYTILSLVNPLLASRIDWFWFVASQVAFGIVAGLVVVRQTAMPTFENLSFAMRAGIEAPGVSPRTRQTRGAPVNRLRYLCASAVLSLLLSACSSPHGQPQKGSEPVAPDQISGLRHSLLAKLCGLSRCARPRRRSHCSFRPGLPGDRGSGFDAEGHRQRRTRNLHAGFRAERRWDADQ